LKREVGVPHQNPANKNAKKESFFSDQPMLAHLRLVALSISSHNLSIKESLKNLKKRSQLLWLDSSIHRKN
jgi:hypothetical protein